jgi:hypothetical protein
MSSEFLTFGIGFDKRVYMIDESVHGALVVFVRYHQVRGEQEHDNF